MAILKEQFIFDGRYKLLKQLGEGGFSEVWLVEDTSAQINQVLKVFHPSAQLDENGVELFRNEFALVYNLNHPNLLKYTFFGVCVGYPYLVMPYYNSGSAEDLLGNCSERKAWQFLHDVASGLACLHEHQPPIIHQDIKPANVLIDNGNFIITDFGISSNVRHILGLSAEGRSTVQGTRPYMPPEKFQANPMPLVAGDIWALGASLYEMLTGSLPFGGKGGEAQLEGEEIPAIQGRYSDELKGIIQQCMAPNPGDRPDAADLANFAQEMIEYNTTGVVRPTYNPARFPSIKLPENSKILQQTQQFQQSQQITGQVPKSNKGLIIGIVAAVVVALGVLVGVLLSKNKKEEEPAKSAYDTALTYYNKGKKAYQLGMRDSQGQLDRFQEAIMLFDSAQFNTEFRTSEYADSIRDIRGRIYDYCLAEGKRNYSSAFYDDGIRKYVLSYLNMAKTVSQNAEVTQLIDSIQYIYVGE